VAGAATFLLGRAAIAYFIDDLDLEAIRARMAEGQETGSAAWKKRLVVRSPRSAPSTSLEGWKMASKKAAVSKWQNGLVNGAGKASGIMAAAGAGAVAGATGGAGVGTAAGFAVAGPAGGAAGFLAGIVAGSIGGAAAAGWGASKAARFIED
jgi:hypothetical protein